jgi:hypothetical protein
MTQGRISDYLPNGWALIDICGKSVADGISNWLDGSGRVGTPTQNATSQAMAPVALTKVILVSGKGVKTTPQIGPG